MVIKKNERKLAKQIKNLANQNIQIDIYPQVIEEGSINILIDIYIAKLIKLM